MKGSQSTRSVRLLLLLPLAAVLLGLLIVGLRLRTERALLAEAEQAVEEAEQRTADLLSQREAAQETAAFVEEESPEEADQASEPQQ